MQLFHKAINRRGTHSIKWDTYKNEELIHAWIADMDFEVPKPIQHIYFMSFEEVPEHVYEEIIAFSAQ